MTIIKRHVTRGNQEQIKNNFFLFLATISIFLSLCDKNKLELNGKTM